MGALYNAYITQAKAIKDDNDTQAIDHNYQLLYNLVTAAPGSYQEINTVGYTQFVLPYPTKEIRVTRWRDGGLEVFFNIRDELFPVRNIPHREIANFLQKYDF